MDQRCVLPPIPTLSQLTGRSTLRWYDHFDFDHDFDFISKCISVHSKYIAWGWWCFWWWFWQWIWQWQKIIIGTPISIMMLKLIFCTIFIAWMDVEQSGIIIDDWLIFYAICSVWMEQRGIIIRCVTWSMSTRTGLRWGFELSGKGDYVEVPQWNI